MGNEPTDVPPQARNWAAAAHLSAFVAAWFALAFLGPLVVWLAKRDDHPFVAEHAREALNFNLLFLILAVIGLVAGIFGALAGIFGGIAGGLFGFSPGPWGGLWAVLGFAVLGLFFVVAGIAWFVLTIVAAVKAANGEPYRYPVSARFVS